MASSPCNTSSISIGTLVTNASTNSRKKVGSLAAISFCNIDDNKNYFFKYMFYNYKKNTKSNNSVSCMLENNNNKMRRYQHTCTLASRRSLFSSTTEISWFVRLALVFLLCLLILPLGGIYEN